MDNPERAPSTRAVFVNRQVLKAVGVFRVVTPANADPYRARVQCHLRRVVPPFAGAVAWRYPSHEADKAVESYSRHVSGVGPKLLDEHQHVSRRAGGDLRLPDAYLHVPDCPFCWQHEPLGELRLEGQAPSCSVSNVDVALEVIVVVLVHLNGGLTCIKARQGGDRRRDGKKRSEGEKTARETSTCHPRHPRTGLTAKPKMCRPRGRRDSWLSATLGN